MKEKEKQEKVETGIFKELVNGTEIIRFSTNRKYNKKELSQMREQFLEEANKGNIICLTDILINHGL